MDMLLDSISDEFLSQAMKQKRFSSLTALLLLTQFVHLHEYILRLSLTVSTLWRIFLIDFNQQFRFDTFYVLCKTILQTFISFYRARTKQEENCNVKVNKWILQNIMIMQSIIKGRSLNG